MNMHCSSSSITKAKFDIKSVNVFELSSFVEQWAVLQSLAKKSHYLELITALVLS